MVALKLPQRDRTLCESRGALVCLEASAAARTAFAQAGEFDPEGEHAAEFAGGLEREFVEFGGPEVADDSAADADVVVMRGRVGVEVDSLAELSVGGDEIEVVEQPEGAVHGIERDRGYAVVNSVEDGLRIRMISA